METLALLLQKPITAPFKQSSYSDDIKPDLDPDSVLSQTMRATVETGLGTSFEISTCLVPALSKAGKFQVDIDPLIETTQGRSKLYEQFGDFVRAGAEYLALSRALQSFFPEESRGSIRLFAVLELHLRQGEEKLEFLKAQFVNSRSDDFCWTAHKEKVEEQKNWNKRAYEYVERHGFNHAKLASMSADDFRALPQARPQLYKKEKPMEKDEEDIFGRTALHHAAATRVRRVDLLATSDKDDRSDVFGWTALHYAAGVPHSGVTASPDNPELCMTKWLLKAESVDEELEAWANPDLYGRTPLHYACLNGNLCCVKALITTSRVDINARARDQATPLHCAAKGTSQNRHSIVKLLLEHSVNREAVDSFRMYPFMWSAYKGDVDTTRLLLEAIANGKKTRDINGRQAAHFAALSGNLDVFYLCEDGQGTELQNEGDVKPWQLAWMAHGEDVAKKFKTSIDNRAKDKGKDGN
jgi:hypothetical protein